MPGVPIVLPALGEGIREIKVVACLKQCGEAVQRDEPLAEVETDKANFVIESPATGLVDTWSVQPGETYPVGTVMTTILHVAEAHPVSGNGAREVLRSERNGRLSPRLRAWCRSRGLDPEDLPDIPCAHPEGRLTTEDIERWLAGGSTCIATPAVCGTQNMLTASIEMHLDWDAVGRVARKLQVRRHKLLAWCAASAMVKHAALHSGPGLGIAVALLRDGLAIARLDCSRLEDKERFFRAVDDAVCEVRTGLRRSEPCRLILSDMSSFGVRSASPIVVPPAVATLFIGEPFDVAIPAPAGVTWKREAKIVLAFDHGVLNGAGAAQFLRHVRQNVAELDDGP